MRQDIIEGIVEPLDGYLSGYLTEKDVDWSELRWCARRNRREGAFWDVREALTPYYHKLIMADKDFSATAIPTPRQRRRFRNCWRVRDIMPVGY